MTTILCTIVVGWLLAELTGPARPLRDLNPWTIIFGAFLGTAALLLGLPALLIEKLLSPGRPTTTQTHGRKL